MEYYIYDSNGYFKEKVQASEQPRNSSPFPPPEKGDGMRPWFDGRGWVSVADYSGMTLEEAQNRASDELSTVTFVYEGDYEYSVAERDSFEAQYQEALAVKGGAEAGPYVSALMGVYDLPAEAMADKILAKRESYTQAQAWFNAKVQAVRLRIQNAKELKDVPSEIEIMKLRKPVPVQ